MRNPRGPVATRAPMLASIVVALALTTGACSGDDAKKSASPEPSASTATSAAPMPTTATLGKVTGRLARKQRAPLEKAVTEAVDRWFDAAFVGGRYPRSDFHDAFNGFTAGARAEARRDRRLMSNADIDRRIDSVEVNRRRLRIDVLAVRGRPVGVTGRFVLVFTTTGRTHERLRVQGSLFLTHAHRHWRIFGYDVTKGGSR